MFKVNTIPVAKADLPNKPNEIYTGRPEKIIFVKGAETGVKYGDVIWARVLLN